MTPTRRSSAKTEPRSMSLPFVDRHIGTDQSAQKTMLETLGYESVTALVEAAVPTSIQSAGAGAGSIIPKPATEREVSAELRQLASQNSVKRSMIGLGYY